MLEILKKRLGRALFSLIKSELDAHLFNPLVFIHLLPGGIMPERQSELAVGYDVHIRALMHNRDRDPLNPDFRRVIFDFDNMPSDPKIKKHIVKVDKADGEGTELAYRLKKGKSVIAGIGFATAMKEGEFYWIAPRSGLATKYGITVTNAPGTVDPDYRGEAGVLVYNRDSEPDYFDLRYGMRIAQIIFSRALVPELRKVFNYSDLPPTERGIKGFGSTGILRKKERK